MVRLTFKGVWSGQQDIRALQQNRQIRGQADGGVGGSAGGVSGARG